MCNKCLEHCTCPKQEVSPLLGTAMLLVLPREWDLLGQPQTKEEWKAALHLPEAYTIRHYIKSSGKRWWSIEESAHHLLYIQHPAVPPGDQHTPFPKLVPEYLENTETHELLLISIAVQVWQAGTWKTIFTDNQFVEVKPDEDR